MDPIKYLRGLDAAATGDDPGVRLMARMEIARLFSALLDVAEAAATHLNAYDGPCSPDEAEVCGYDGYMCEAEREWTLARHRALAGALAALDAAVAREMGGSDE